MTGTESSSATTGDQRAPMTQLGRWLLEELAYSERQASESSKIARNSYGAGYDAGYAAGLKRILDEISEINELIFLSGATARHTEK